MSSPSRSLTFTLTSTGKCNKLTLGIIDSHPEMSLLLLFIPLILETFLICFFSFCALFLNYLLLHAIIADLGHGVMGKDTDPYEHKEKTAMPRCFGNENRRTRVRSAKGWSGGKAQTTSIEQLSEAGSRELGGAGEGGMSYTDWGAGRGVLRGSYWICEDGDGSDGEGYGSEDEGIESGEEYAEGNEEGEVSELASDADTSTISFSGQSTVISLSREAGAASRCRRRERGSCDEEQQEPSKERNGLGTSRPGEG